MVFMNKLEGYITDPTKLLHLINPRILQPLPKYDTKQALTEWGCYFFMDIVAEVLHIKIKEFYDNMKGFILGIKTKCMDWNICILEGKI